MTLAGQKSKRNWLRKQFKALQYWLWMAPETNPEKWRLILKALLRIHYIVIREFNSNRIILRSSALTFTVVLAMVPMLALGTAVLKSIGTNDKMRQSTHLFVERLAGPVQSSETNPLLSPDSSTVAKDEQSGADYTGHLHTAVDKIFDYVDQTDFTALGTVGVIGLVIAVLLMLDSIAEAMNTIWQAEKDRSLSRKIVDYLALIILLPITMNIAFALVALLSSPALLSFMKEYIPLARLGSVMLKILPLLLIILTFTFLYRFLPNTTVNLLPAFTGAVTGGIGLLLTQTIYVRLQIGVAKYNAIYGSFATLPLFLMWIYAAWIVFLTGAEIAYGVQIWRRYIPDNILLSPAQRLALAFDIVETAAADFKKRRPTTSSGLAGRLGLPAPYIKDIMEELRQKGILRKVKNKETAYLPAGPAENICAEEIIEALFGKVELSSSGGVLASGVMQAARSAVLGKKIIT